MWFKNLQLYRLTESFGLSAEQLHEKMLSNSTKPCQGLDTFTLGWDKPLGREGQLLTHVVNNCIMVCVRREERVLPSAVIRDILEEKVAEIEESEARSVRRKEKMQLKDEIMVDLLPRAFTRSSKTFAYIDVEKGWVIVDAVAAKKAEDLLTLMRDTLGSFKVKPFEVKQSPSAILTDWLKRRPAGGFELENECELRDTLEDGGIVRLRRHGLNGSEIDAHLDAGKIVTKLAVSWEEKLSCILADDASIKRLKFLDVIQEEAGHAETDSAVEQFDVNFSLMSLELRKFVQRLVEIYGGLSQD
jgi:recombination associated protein RdgC